MCAYIRKKSYVFFFICAYLFITEIGSAQINNNCDSAKVGRAVNLGLYGGWSTDLTFSDNGRLFAGCIVPYSMFISDDTAKTWYPAFPYDSLEFECGDRGWSGGANSIITNRKKWVGVYTLENSAEKISSSQISFSNGDTGSWHTAMDGFLLQSMGYKNRDVSAIAMSDYYFYVLLQNYIVRIDTSLVDSSDIIDIYAAIPGLDTSNILKSMAVANSAAGYPFYVVIDSSANSTPLGRLYRYNGVTFTKISLPSGVTGLSKVFTHPNQITGDTIFISGVNSTGKIRLHASYDGGSTWNNISPGTNSSYDYLADAIYSPAWKSQMPLSNGLLLINGLSYISKDLGNNWIKTASIPQGTGTIYSFTLAMHPADTTLFAGSNTPGIYISNSGCNGPLIQPDCEGLEAVIVSKIEHNLSESVFYLATQSGLAYTTKYTDTNVTFFDKWVYPNGQFPVYTTDVIGGITSVAIDPKDSAHVVAGWSTGFFVSHTGPDGFISVLPTAYDVGAMQTKDIAFVSSDIVIAVSGTNKEPFKGNGDIWRSADGGDSWTNVSPSGFGTGGTVAVGFGKTDTVIYVGSGLTNVETGYLWKSTDMGLSWTQINTGPSDQMDSTITGLSINDIAVDSRGKDTLYIAAGASESTAFVKSTDGGISYQTNFVNAMEGYFKAVEIDPFYPDSIIYLAHGKKLYEYNPNLDTARLLYTSLPGDLIRDISIGSIIVGTTTGFYGVEKEDEGIVTSISPANTNNYIALFVYPNPITNEAFIKIEGIKAISKDLNITLYDVMGRPVKKIMYNNYSSDETIRFDASALSNGIYYLKMDTGADMVNGTVMVIKD